MKAPRIGALRHRITLESVVRLADGGGGAHVSWVPVAEIWAGIMPVSGAETVTGEAVAGRVSHEIVIRHRAGVEPAMRFRYGGRLFEIAAVMDRDERRRLLRCLCREEFL